MACRFDDGALALTEVDGAYVHGASGMCNAVHAAGSTRRTSLSRKRDAASATHDPTSFTRRSRMISSSARTSRATSFCASRTCIAAHAQ